MIFKVVEESFNEWIKKMSPVRMVPFLIPKQVLFLKKQ